MTVQYKCDKCGKGIHERAVNTVAFFSGPDGVMFARDMAEYHLCGDCKDEVEGRMR